MNQKQKRLAAYKKEWRTKNKDKIAKTLKRYYARNREHILLRAKEYRVKNRELLITKSKVRYALNKKKVALAGKIYRTKNRIKISVRRKKLYAENRDRMLKRQRRYSHINREHLNAMSQARSRIKLTEKQRRLKAERQRRDYHASSYKPRARSKLTEAIKRGRVKPANHCAAKSKRCYGKLQAHHSDYSKPLEATWFCTKHHRGWHRVFIAEGQ